jgi:hypothetical protein
VTGQADIRRGRIAAVLIAVGLHIAVLTVLGLSRGRMVLIPPVTDAVPLQMRLVRFADLGAPVAHAAAHQPRERTVHVAAKVAQPPAIPSRAKPVAPAPPVEKASVAPPSAPATPSPGMMGPPTATASAAAALVGGVRTTLRDNIGCDDEKYLKMPSSEREKCTQRFGRLAKDAPHVRALDLEQKAYFDGDCDPPDDEWCLYRRGKGPYPGLLSLYRKYHPHNDH